MKYYTLTAEDIGAAFLHAFGRVWPVQDFIGRILSDDVGKRVYPRGGILQVENDEQRAARIAAWNTPMFDDDVAWLQFLADWEGRANGPPLTTPERDKRLMRIAFNWAREHPKGQSAPRPKSQQSWCECNIADVSDHHCLHNVTLYLFRVTAYVHETPIHEQEPVVFCEPCGDKALESGLYCAGDDLLEPNHGPDCAKRMLDDPKEGGQS